MNVRVELWNDIGYTESGVERPPIDAPAPTEPDAYFDIKPATADLFTSFSVKAPYRDLMSVSYLRATYDFNNANRLIVYGWVDGVAPKSDTEDYPNTEITWHVDLWRTYSSLAEFKAGTVHRRPMSADMPPQPYPYRYRRHGDAVQLMNRQRFIWWILMDYVVETSDHEVTSIEHAAFPVDQVGSSSLYIAATSGATAYKCPSWGDVLSGKFDEKMGVAPSTIISVSLSPIPPCSAGGTGTQADPIYLNGLYFWGIRVHDDYRWFGTSAATMTNAFQEYSASLAVAVTTSDTAEYVVTSLDGSVIGTLPWGLEVQDYTYRVVDEVSSHYIQVRFGGVEGGPEGLTFTIPLPAMAVTSNSWSEYVYSGQREYDINMRNLQSMQAMVGGLTGGFETGVQTTQMANLNTRWKPTTFIQSGTGPRIGTEAQRLANARMKAINGPVNQQMLRNNLLKGATAGLAQAGLAAAQGALDMYYFNPEYQEWEDYKQARQTDNIILPGGGGDVMYYGSGITLMAMVSDEYSQLQRTTDIAMYGAHVTEPMASCQELVEAGGPLQITNMTVGGPIPVEAKEYIRMMFSNGVRLV